MSNSTWVILGAGYTGVRLAQRLASEGQAVIVTRRDPAAAASTAAAIGAVEGVAMDLTRPESLVVPDGAIVVCLAQPGADPVAETAALAHATRNAERLVYVSSTGVYPSANGQWVDETWPIAPVTAAGQARAAAEAALPGDACSLRVAGIHGPGRGLLERIRSGTYRIVGSETSHVSRIHVVDLVDAIIRAGATAFAGAINIADDDPAPIGEVADTIADALGVPRPPRVPADSVAPEVAGMLTADRRIANTRMKEKLGVVLRYPSWRTLITDVDAGVVAASPRT